jgi:hypothetical protein
MEAKQEDITWRMRGILMDWLIEIHSKFRLLPETIFLTANIIDRFCSVRSVSVIKYQLMGVTALFIASKYEEIMCPSMSNFLFMTDGGYTDEEFLKAERYVLQMIGWDLSYPNPINFLRRISKADDYDIQSRTVAKYFMELTVVDSHFVGRPPSEIAAAAAWLARKVLDRGEWVRSAGLRCVWGLTVACAGRQPDPLLGLRGARAASLRPAHDRLRRTLLPLRRRHRAPQLQQGPLASAKTDGRLTRRAEVRLAQVLQGLGDRPRVGARHLVRQSRGARPHQGLQARQQERPRRRALVAREREGAGQVVRGAFAGSLRVLVLMLVIMQWERYE